MWCLSREKTKTIKDDSRLVSEIGYFLLTGFFLNYSKQISSQNTESTLKSRQVHGDFYNDVDGQINTLLLQGMLFVI